MPILAINQSDKEEIPLVLTSDNEATSWPGVVHGHAEVDLPLPGSHLHGPHEGRGVAGDGHGACDPPGDNKDRIPDHKNQ